MANRLEAEDRDYSVRAVDRVCAILNLLQESINGVSLIDIAQATELPKSSAFRYLWTLESHRYVERDLDSGLYRLGLGFVGMQSRHVEVLRQRARPLLERLRDEFGETVNLGILDGDSAIYLDIVESRRSVRLAASCGDRDPIHSTALGKAIAAHLPEPQVKEILTGSGMPARTVNTITSIDDYLAELAKVRERGYALDDEETVERTYPRQARTPFNLLGVPALAMPCGFSSDGMPLAFQIVGKPFDEATVYRAAWAYEQDAGWHARRPPLD
jgi:IclR family transcriptional regulator, acetate operon repressor